MTKSQMTNDEALAPRPRFVPAALVVGVALLTSCSAPHSPAAATTQPVATSTDFAGLPNFARVSPVLYRGGQPKREGFQTLKQMGIKTVVDLRGSSHRDDIEGLGFNYVHIPSSALRVESEKVLQFLRVVQDPANQPVFVHCHQGADRAGCCVAVYRMVEQGWTARDAEAELRQFHFSPLWAAIPAYLDQFDAEQMRARLLTPTTRPTIRIAHNSVPVAAGRE